MYTSAVASMGTLRATAKVCRICGRLFAVTGAELHYQHELNRCRECRKANPKINNFKEVNVNG